LRRDDLTLWNFPAKVKVKRHPRDTKPRLIAIPKVLSDWVKEHGNDGKILNKHIVSHYMKNLKIACKSRTGWHQHESV
jgi:hypothetical protein